MQNRRDSSVWRSLAVAFGDGVAFGVGMKLSQSATSRGAVSPAASESSSPVAGRLEQLERRLAEVEHKPAAIAPPATVDQKLLEAVVGAVDARLREYAEQVERRLSTIEAGLAAELQTLRQQDDAVAAAVESHMEKLQDHVLAQVESVRAEVEQNHAAMREQIASTIQSLRGEIAENRGHADSSRAAAREDLASAAETILGEVEQVRAEMRQNVASAVEAASFATLERCLGTLRAEALAKDLEIEELRHRVEASDNTVLEVLSGIGEVIRQATNGRTPGGRPSAPEAPPPAAEPPAETAPENLEPATENSVQIDPPQFTESERPRLPWRMPLVSSMAFAAFSLTVLHYL